MQLFRWILLPIIRFYFNIRFRVEVRNEEILADRTKPVIFVSNHPSLLDTVFYKCLIGNDFYVCGARAQYFSTKWKRFIMRLGNVIPVSSKEQYLQDCSGLLAKGNCLLIYPEMKRNKTLGNFENWVSHVAIENQVSIIPMKITGTEQSNKKNISIYIGLPVQSEEWVDRFDELTNFLHKTINAL